MTLTEYANELNKRLYYYLLAKVQRYQMDPFIIRFSLIVEPLRKILNTPVLMEGMPCSLKRQRQMEFDSRVWHLIHIYKFLDILKNRRNQD